MRYAITNEIDDRARSGICNGLLNNNTQINRIEIQSLVDQPKIIHVHEKAVVILLVQRHVRDVLLLLNRLLQQL